MRITIRDQFGIPMPTRLAVERLEAQYSRDREEYRDHCLTDRGAYLFTRLQATAGLISLLEVQE